VREFTYVSDVVAATTAAGEVPVSGSVAINVGGGSSVSVRTALDIAAEVVGRPVPLVSRPARAGDVPMTAADLTAAHDVLGYEPRVDLRAGMEMHARWLAERKRPAALTAVRAGGGSDRHR
jgi:nucleoside-diphosphate-sugar epimerase